MVCMKTCIEFNHIRFTNKQWEVVKLLAEGYSNKDIQHELSPILTPNSTGVYINSVLTLVRESYPELKDRNIRVILGQWIVKYTPKEC